jgi:hypothetical protein
MDYGWATGGFQPQIIDVQMIKTIKRQVKGEDFKGFLARISESSAAFAFFFFYTCLLIYPFFADETTSFSFPPRQHATEFSDEEAESASRGKQNMFLPPTPPPSRMSNKPGSTGKIGWEHQEVEGFYALRSQSGNRIACVHIRQSAQAPFTFLYSHGNSCDFGHVLHFLSVLCTVLYYSKLW